MTNPFESSRRATTIGLLLALVACALLYWPGLNGGYIFDDFIFIIENPDLLVRSNDIGAWIRAADSFPATHQGRWLTMLTFAANHYLTGLDPFWFKLTNLFIHLLNGVLVYCVIRMLLALVAAARGHVPDAQARARAGWIAVAIAACWLVLPINLTAVLYAVQRLESFSNTFVLAGLLWYLHARLRYEQTGRGIGALAAALVIGTGVGVLAKESAVLLPLYTACVEFFAVGLRDPNGRWRKPVLGLYAVLLAVPLVVGLIWLASWIYSPTTYARSYSTVERLLTEARVLVDYIRWTLLPTPKVASLYHDDIVVSKGLFSPTTTALSILALAALAAFALWFRRTRPLVGLGIAWFFAGHLLTGTIIPLELVFEHRNYFPSIGLLLAVAALLSIESPWRLGNRPLVTIVVTIFAFYALLTGLRAREWSHPLKLALSEVSNNTRSPRAHYEFARTLLSTPDLMDKPALLNKAIDGLKLCLGMQRNDILCEQALIITAARMGQPAEAGWWSGIVDRFKKSPASESDLNGLSQLVKCQIDKVCPIDARIVDALDATQILVPRQPRIWLEKATYEWHIRNDAPAAEALMRKTIAADPGDPAIRAFLIELLVDSRKFAEAREELAQLRKLDRMGSLDHMTGPLSQLIDVVESQSAPSAGPSQGDLPRSPADHR